MKRSWINSVLVIAAGLFLIGCEEEVYIPKPVGFYRIDLPEAEYAEYSPENCPYSFEINTKSKVQYVKGNNGQECWINLVYPEHKSKVHFSFYNANEEKIDELISDSRKLAMKHLAKADNYEESQIVDSTNSVFGTIYDFEGSAASNYQFFLTDKSSKFIRGALYFEVAPNSDSLAPVELYIQKDLDHLIQTFSWK